jgi:hypothetical protein
MLGAEHALSLTTANNLPTSFSYQGKFAEAEQMLQAALASCQRALGPAHPTRWQSHSLEHVRAHIRATPPPTNAATQAAAGAA